MRISVSFLKLSNNMSFLTSNNDDNNIICPVLIHQNNGA